MAEAEAEAVDFGEGEALVADFGDVEEASFEVIPAGMYNCQIVECEFTYSEAKGTPMWSLQLEVSDGEYAGRKLFTHWVMAGKGMPFTKKDLAQVAPELLEAPFNPQDPEVVASILGRDVRAKVKVGTYQGDKNNNVRGLFAADGEGSGFG